MSCWSEETPAMSYGEINANPDVIRDEWISRLDRLVNDIEAWARSLDWTVQRIDKSMKDSVIGLYKAPGLVMQKNFTRILLDPISRTTLGSDGLVDIYLMPALDDVASIYFYEGRWNVHYQLPNSEAITTVRDAEAKPLTRETLAEVLDGLALHAA
ncbi:MAG: hypothetical protein NVSMB9_19660 [Isosphaeraceae bacterium]